jgi:hypothetical protein
MTASEVGRTATGTSRSLSPLQYVSLGINPGFRWNLRLGDPSQLRRKAFHMLPDPMCQPLLALHLFGCLLFLLRCQCPSVKGRAIPAIPSQETWPTETWGSLSPRLPSARSSPGTRTVLCSIRAWPPLSETVSASHPDFTRRVRAGHHTAQDEETGDLQASRSACHAH